MDHPLRQLLGPPLVAIAITLIIDGVRRVRRGGDAATMLIGLAEICIPASFVLGFALAILGAPAPGSLR